MNTESHLPCDDPESCEFAFTISAEEAYLLINEVLGLDIINL
ncbi:hypothetical protein [Patiriisocius sp. Uisw_017]|jgi:hypothetical protein